MADRLGTHHGTAAGGEKVRAYVPPPLPPEPPLMLTGLIERLGAADRALGRLDGASLLLPNRELFLYMYVRKEAVLSSQIEGTQSSLNDLLQFESDVSSGAPLDDVREVSNYVAAMMHGLERLDTLPLSLRLIREMHEILLDSGRGSGLAPGEFRTTQNWIGGTRPGNAVYVPPPPHVLMPALGEFEKFIHAETPSIPPLIKAGLLHVQFESIHPFLDGNGRIGRLLITLFLCAQGVMREPLLYLSLYFKEHRAQYYQLLQEVRERGAWEAWLEFFLEGVAETANAAFETASRATSLFADDRARLAALSDSAGSILRLHEALKTSPIATAAALTRMTGLTMPTVNLGIEKLRAAGIAKEITGKRRGRVFAYEAYLALLESSAGGLPGNSGAA
jgi:Fic family protein